MSADRDFKKLLDFGIVWDNHACMPLRPRDVSFLPQLRRVRDAGIDVVSLNVSYGSQRAGSAFAMLSAFRTWLQQRPSEYLLIDSESDIYAAQASGRLGVCFDVEGMGAIDGDTDNVTLLYDQGVRWMLAAYNESNVAGGGCLGDDAGLTTFGRRVVAEMNSVGMAVCAAHCGYRTARELIDHSTDPVIFSHANPLALRDHPRNLPDNLMKACASRGGVIGISGFGPFLGDNDASTSTYVAHIEYVLDLLGEDHVGIALDYVFDRDELDRLIASDPATFPPHLYRQGANMVEPWRLPEIAQELAARGHSAVTLQKLFGGNHLRIARQIWR
jgi:membrane dipeptidase